MKCTFNWKLSTTGEENLARKARATLETFFKYCPEIPSVTLTVQRIETVARPRADLITSAVHQNHPGYALIVYVRTEGSQVLTCAMQVEGYSRRRMKRLIDDGPYSAPPRKPVCVEHSR